MPVAGPIVVTYHYVRPRNSDGVTGITPEGFDAQLARIAETHTFVSAETFVDLLQVGGGRTTAPVALVTFDDAVRDQYEFAAPVLARRGVPAVFYAPMRPHDESIPEPDRWCPQHLLHALAERLGWAETERRIRARLRPHETVADEQRMHTLYHYEIPRKRWLKFVLAFALPAERAAALLREINLAPDGPRLAARDWYMTADQLASLQAAGHALGGHGFDHLAYSTLTPSEQAWDMARAAELMNRLFGRRARTLAYPFGRATAETRLLARIMGYTHGFTTDDRIDCQFLDRALGAAPRAA